MGSYNASFEALLRRSALDSAAPRGVATATTAAATTIAGGTAALHNLQMVQKHVMRGASNVENANVKRRLNLLSDVEKRYYKTNAFYATVAGESRRVLQATHPCLTRQGLMLSQEIAGVLSTRLGSKNASLLLWHSAGSGKTFAMVRILFWWCLKWWGETPPYSLPLTGEPTGKVFAAGSSNQHLPRFIFIVADDEQLTNMIDTFDLFEGSKLNETLTDMDQKKGGAAGVRSSDVMLYREQIAHFFSSMPSRKVVVVPLDSANDKNAAVNATAVPKHFSLQSLENFGVRHSNDPKRTFLALGNPRLPGTEVLGLLSNGYLRGAGGGAGVGSIEDASSYMGSSLRAFFVSFFSQNELQKGAADIVPSDARLVAGSYIDICTDLCRQNTTHPSLSHALKMIPRDGVVIHTWTDKNNAPTAGALQAGDFVRFVYKDTVVSPIWYITSSRRVASPAPAKYIFQMNCLMTAYVNENWFKSAMPLTAQGDIRSDFKVYDIFRFNIPIQCRLQRVDQTIVSQAQMTFPYSQLAPIIRQAGGDLNMKGDGASFWGTSSWWIAYNSIPRYRGNAELEAKWKASTGLSSQQSRGKIFSCPTTLVIGMLPETFAAFTRLPKHSLVIVDEIQKNTDSVAESNGHTLQPKNPGFVTILKKSIRHDNCYAVAATATPYSRDLRDLGQLLSCMGHQDVTFTLSKPGEAVSDSALLKRHRQELAHNLKKAKVLLSFVDLDQDATMLPTLVGLDSATSVVEVVPSRAEFMRKEPATPEDSIGGEAAATTASAAKKGGRAQKKPVNAATTAHKGINPTAWPVPPQGRAKHAAAPQWPMPRLLPTQAARAAPTRQPLYGNPWV